MTTKTHTATLDRLDALLLDNNFTDTEDLNGTRRVTKHIFGDCYIDLLIDREYVSYMDLIEVEFSLRSRKFSKIMSFLFSEELLFEASSYKKRHYNNDDEYGCLGTSSAALYYERKFEDSSFLSGGQTYRVEEIINRLDEASTAYDLYTLLYKDKFAEFIALIEGVWVFLFLCFEIGLSSEDILDEFSNSYIGTYQKRWFLEKPFDKNIIQLFNKGYLKVLP